MISSEEKPVDVKIETIRSLIDFDADPEPIAQAIPQAQETTVPQPVLQPGNASDDNWASFDVASEAKTTPSTSSLNPLESMLSQLSVSASFPAHVSGVQGDTLFVTATSSGNVINYQKLSTHLFYLQVLFQKQLLLLLLEWLVLAVLQPSHPVVLQCQILDWQMQHLLIM